MQASTSDAVASIGGITQTIAQMSEITVLNFDRDRAAGRRYPRNRAQHPVGRGRLQRNQHAYRRRHLRRRRPPVRRHPTYSRTPANSTNQSGMLRHAVDEFLSKVRAA